VPYQTLAASEILNLVDGTQTRPLFVWVAPENAASGINCLWLDPTLVTTLKSRQMRANVTGVPSDIGPFGWFVPAYVAFSVENRSAGATTVVQWTVYYDAVGLHPVQPS